MPPPSIRRTATMSGYDEAQERGLDPDVLKRAWRFAAAYRGRLFLSLLTLAAASGIAILPPLVFRHLIDDAIPQQDFGMVNWLFLAAVVLAATSTALGLLNRWFSARIGEGLIYDLRVALYAHTQRMPIGFFTRTQTGSLLSRLNNDVVGAQATITTAATVASDLLTLTATLAAMLALSWKVTLIALSVIPFFVILDRKVGRRFLGDAVAPTGCPTTRA